MGKNIGADDDEGATWMEAGGERDRGGCGLGLRKEVAVREFWRGDGGN